MSAEILGCGHACHLMEIDFMESAPQVHLHFLTEPEEYEELGYGKVELVCHGCGQSMLIYYNDRSSVGSKHMRIRDAFVAKHQRCPNRKFEDHCPNYRSNMEFKDIRAKPKERKVERGPFSKRRSKGKAAATMSSGG